MDHEERTTSKENGLTFEALPFRKRVNQWWVGPCHGTHLIGESQTTFSHLEGETSLSDVQVIKRPFVFGVDKGMISQGSRNRSRDVDHPRTGSSFRVTLRLPSLLSG